MRERKMKETETLASNRQIHLGLASINANHQSCDDEANLGLFRERESSARQLGASVASRRNGCGDLRDRLLDKPPPPSKTPELYNS